MAKTSMIERETKRAKLNEEGKPNNLGRALFADSAAILGGSLIGTSSVSVAAAP